MRHPLIPAALLAVGLLIAPVAAAQAAPCDGKFSCAPTEGSDEPSPTQPGIAPEEDKKPLPHPEPTRDRETHQAPAPAQPVQAPPVQASSLLSRFHPSPRCPRLSPWHPR